MWHSRFRWFGSRNQDERELFRYSSHFLFAFTEKNDCGLSDGCANDDGKQEPNTITNGKGTFKITAAYIMDVNNQIHKRTLSLSIEVNA